MALIRVQAQALKPGDVTEATSEKVIKTFYGVAVPSRKIGVTLEGTGKSGKRYRRTAYWGKTTVVKVERAE